MPDAENQRGGLAAQEATILRCLAEDRVVPVATIEDPGQAEPTARALLEGGIRCIEITFRTSGAAEAIRRARRVEGMLVGAGTVLSPEQATSAVGAGAHFALAPGLNEDVIRACRSINLPFFPGAATPTEVERIRARGLGTAKIFPASSLGGPSFVSAVSAVYPEMRFIPTGGIGLEACAGYLALPSVVAVGGSWLVAPELLCKGDYAEIARRAREAKSLAA